MLTTGYNPASGAMIDAFPSRANAKRIARFPSPNRKPSAITKAHVRPLGMTRNGSHASNATETGMKASKNQNVEASPLT